jgi:ubiquitin-activating enzyme E1
LFAYPLDHKTTEGLPFWSGPKRAPKAERFNINDPLHLELVQSAANIYAFMLGLPYCHDLNKIKEIVSKVEVPEF